MKKKNHDLPSSCGWSNEVSVTDWTRTYQVFFLFACIPICFPPYWMVEEGKLMWPFTVPNLKVISGLVVFCWKKKK